MDDAGRGGGLEHVEQLQCQEEVAEVVHLLSCRG